MNIEINKIKFKLGLVLVWLIFIFVLSGRLGAKTGSLSSSVITDLQTYAPNASQQVATYVVRKAAHIFMYSVLGILIANLLNSYKLSFKRVFGFGVLFAAVYACFDEVHQYFVGGRSSSPRDVLIDVAGAIIGICIYYGYLKISNRYHKSLNKKGS